MGLPHPDSAKAWGGKLLVDREGTAIGTCTEIFVDDATGLPEWAAADLSGGSAFIPLMDAAEAGDHVRVAVRQADVADAPLVAEPGHISTDEEERLYRHYGIEFSQEASETLLPVDEPPIAAELRSSISSTSPATEVADALEENRGRLLPALAAGTVGGIAAIAAALFWWRQLRQVPPTRKELLAARAHAAALALATRGEQVAASAAPLVRSGSQLSAAAAQRAAAAASVAIAELQRVSRRSDPEPEPVVAGNRSWQKHGGVLGVLEVAAGFAAGYALRARAGATSLEQLKQATTTWSERLQAGNGQLSRRAGAISERVRRRSSGPSA